MIQMFRVFGGEMAGDLVSLPALLLGAREENSGRWVVGFSESTTSNKISCQSFDSPDAALLAISNRCRLGSIVRYCRYEREA